MNMKYAKKLTKEQQEEIITTYFNTETTLRELAETYDVSKQAIHKIVKKHKEQIQ